MDRAEEIIVDVYRQITEIQSRGRQPEKVIMLPELWQLVNNYRQSLGIIDGPHPDYLSEDTLFGLEIWYGNNPGIRVE